MNDMSLYYKDINFNCSSESFKGVNDELCNGYSSISVDSYLNMKKDSCCKYNLTLGLTYGIMGNFCNKLENNRKSSYMKLIIGIDNYNYKLKKLEILRYPGIIRNKIPLWYSRLYLKNNIKLILGFKLDCDEDDINFVDSIGLQIPLKLDTNKFNFVSGENSGINFLFRCNNINLIKVDNLSFGFMISYHGDLDDDGILSCMPRVSCNF